MDPRSILTTFQVEHRHSDGGFGAMAEVRPHDDAAENDLERSWGLRRIFRCKSCDEEVSIIAGNLDDAPAER